MLLSCFTNTRVNSGELEKAMETTLSVFTLVPEVFPDISLHERAAREPRSGEKEKPLVTLDLNLTFMKTPAVKRVNLIIQKGTNGSLAIACLSAANVCTQVVRSGIF